MKNKCKRYILLALSTMMLFMIAGCSGNASEKDAEGDKDLVIEEPKALPIATIKVKDYGTITLELYPHKAPNTVNNFIELANSGFYDGLIFHRVIEGFMNQGGDPDGIGTGGPGYSIEGEFESNDFVSNDINHEKGVISMARSQSPDSAGSQFFIMGEDAPHLDGDYAAFGMTIEGMDVVEAINKVETGMNDKPAKDVVIEEIRVDTKGATYDAPKKLEN